LKKALDYLEGYEFAELITTYDRLKALRTSRRRGAVDCSLALQVLVSRCEYKYLENALLKFVTENSHEDFRKMLGLCLVEIRLTWIDGFDKFLRERKRRRKVLTGEMIRKYKSYFERYRQYAFNKTAL